MTELLDKETDLPVSAGEDDMRQFCGKSVLTPG